MKMHPAFWLGLAYAIAHAAIALTLVALGFRVASLLLIGLIAERRYTA
jgi:hypothetical protein